MKCKYDVMFMPFQRAAEFRSSGSYSLTPKPLSRVKFTRPKTVLENRYATSQELTENNTISLLE